MCRFVPNVTPRNRRHSTLPCLTRLSFHSTILIVIFHIFYTLSCQTSLVIASSRGPPPPPPPPPPPSWGHYDEDIENGNDYDDIYKNEGYHDGVDGTHHLDDDRDGNDHDRYYNTEIKNKPRDNRYRHNQSSKDYRFEDTDSRNYMKRSIPRRPPPPPPRTHRQSPPLSSSSDASRKSSVASKKSTIQPASTSFFNRLWKRTSSDDRSLKKIDKEGKQGADETRIEKTTLYKATAKITDDTDASLTKEYNPIDYQFPTKSISTKDSSSKQGPIDLEEDIPLTGNADDGNDDVFPLQQKYNKESLDINQGPMPRYASARQDAIARYRSTQMGKTRLGTSSFLVGSIVGGFMGQSIFNNGKRMTLLFGVMFWIMSMLRNDYGEMSRALGLGLIYLLQRTKAVRRQYRTGPHIRGMCRLGPRKPFPPIALESGEENPWRYVPISRDDPDFEMAKSLLCVVLIGSICGGNMPLIPTWMGSAGGAVAFAVFGLGKNARGDLMRTMGMRVVALTSEAMRINSDLRIASKVMVVSGKVFDKIMILDRKHRIKDRLVRGATMAYDMASRTFTTVQNDIQQGGSSSSDRYSRGKNDDERRRSRS